MLTMGRNRTMTTQRVASSIAQSSTYCHSRRNSHRLLKYFTGLLKHEWGTTYWTGVACCGTLYFVWMKRSWLFRKRKSLKLPCVFLYKMIYIFHCPSPASRLKYNCRVHHFCWSKGEEYALLVPSFYSLLLAHQIRSTPSSSDDM